MAFNPNELILDKVRSLTAHDLSDGKMLFRLTSLEDPTLNCTAEGEEVTDAVGAVITTLYRAKKATFGATNSLISLDLAAAQYGTKKKVGASDAKITDYMCETLTVGEDHTVVLSKEATEEPMWVYAIENNEIGTAYKSGESAADGAFTFGEDNKTITLPEGVTGKVFVEYTCEAENAVEIVNRASEFPEACSVVVYAYFRDKCNENVVYSGKILCPKAKLNPESIELALTSTGKHAFEFTMMKDYCAEEGDDTLFSIIVAE